MSRKQTEVEVEPSPRALARLDPQALIQQAIQAGSTIETLERLFSLAKDVRAEQARELWHRAMAEFQRTCPPIRRSETARITSKRTGSSYSYSYAPLGEIMQTILPVMGPLGLSASYRVRHEGERVIASARISHEAGHHEESGEVSMPVVSGDDMGANPAQRVGIASTYAKRYALLAILGLAPEDDPDGGEGKPEPVSEPRRKSEPAAPAEAPARAAELWVGCVQSVAEKSGETNGKPWTLWTLATPDGTTFGTFDRKHADFAREAGTSPVEITWEQTAKGGRRVLSIEPHLGSGA